jgi:two-component system, NarL family, sensor kinase
MTMPDATMLQRNRELYILNHIAETLNRASDIGTALDDTLASVIELLGLQTGWIFLLDDSGKLFVAAHHDLPPALAHPGVAWWGGCNCNTLFKSGDLREAVNIVQCSRLAEAAGDRHGLEFHASAPLRSEARMLGILNVASPGSDRFTPDVLLLLSAVGAQLGTAIERVRLAQRAVDLAALEERNRIAREIHDTLAQGLTAITLHLEAAQALATTKPDIAQRKVDQALQLARTNLEEARRSVLNLRAAPLEGRTLPEALRLLAQQFAADNGILVAAEIDGTLRQIAPNVEAGLYRVAQEALSNVRKHAEAQRVTLRLEHSDGQLRLTIADDGAGFDPERVVATATGGYGITGMSERARLLGGRLDLHSAPGQGTRIVATVPA